MSEGVSKVMGEMLSQNEIDHLLSAISCSEYPPQFNSISKCVKCKYKEEYMEIVEENRHLKELLKIYYNRREKNGKHKVNSCY